MENGCWSKEREARIFCLIDFAVVKLYLPQWNNPCFIPVHELWGQRKARHLNWVLCLGNSGSSLCIWESVGITSLAIKDITKRWENYEAAETLLYFLLITVHIAGLGKNAALPGGNRVVLGSIYYWNYFLWWKSGWSEWTELSFQRTTLSFRNTSSHLHITDYS